jgi:uncharacterized membrane protein
MPATDARTTDRSGTVAVHRLLAFCDAVVAIGITLLVLPLVELVPEALHEHLAPIDVVRENTVPIVSFLLSFVVIWRIWSVHHQLFGAVEAVPGRVVFLNMIWLACIVFLPFPVALVGGYGSDPFVLRLYVGVLLASAITLAGMAVALRRMPAGDDGAVPPRSVVERVVGNAACLAVAFVVVLAVPAASFWPLLLLFADGPVLAIVRRLGDRRRR